ncbi:EamA family transporter [Candidatus Parcubacteria bacterium]|nr:EamA family transporter [Candidatus Parcubacteria bacterium]
MHWFFIALAAPALWSVSNHIDKFVISNYFSGKGVGSLVLFTALGGSLVAILIAIFSNASFNLGSAHILVIALSGAILVAAFIPYLHALEIDEASYVTALFQMIPVFGYVLAFLFLGENLSVAQTIGSALIIGASIFMSLDLSEHIRIRMKPLLLMMLSSLMISLNALLFKVIALDESFWGTAFWEYVGAGVFGLLLFVLYPLYRTQFLATLTRSRFTVLGLNTFSECLNIGAKLLANFASLLAPLALVWVVNGFQPLIVFLYGVILTLFIPKWGTENLSAKVILQKLTGMAVIFVGVALLFA